MTFSEVEFKYKAEDISLSAFKEFCLARSPLKAVEASGFDHFYASNAGDSSFCRHRVGADTNQLTFKRKTVETNCFIRTEHNIDLAPPVSLPQVAALCEEFGYSYNTSIFKNCFVYKYDWHMIAYYICYDVDMRELGRFVEIEMSEEYDWKNEKEAYSQLIILEKTCKSLGLGPQSRVKQSLFDMYRDQRK